MAYPTDQVATGDLITAAQINRWEMLLADSLVAGSAVASIDFTSIPAHWTHLRVEIEGRVSGAVVADFVRMRFNNDSTNSYNWQQLQAVNAAVSAGPATLTSGILFATIPGSSAAGDVASGGSAVVPNYAGTTFHKSARSFASSSGDDTAANQRVDLFGGRWKSTAAINRITLTVLGGSNFEIGTRASIYGCGRI